MKRSRFGSKLTRPWPKGGRETAHQRPLAGLASSSQRRSLPSQPRASAPTQLRSPPRRHPASSPATTVAVDPPPPPHAKRVSPLLPRLLLLLLPCLPRPAWSWPTTYFGPIHLPLYIRRCCSPRLLLVTRLRRRATHCFAHARPPSVRSIHEGYATTATGPPLPPSADEHRGPRCHPPPACSRGRGEGAPELVGDPAVLELARASAVALRPREDQLSTRGLPLLVLPPPHGLLIGKTRP
jgi:hypothetical protein